jgi:hypothetical protein
MPALKNGVWVIAFAVLYALMSVLLAVFGLFAGLTLVRQLA